MHEWVSTENMYTQQSANHSANSGNNARFERPMPAMLTILIQKLVHPPPSSMCVLQRFNAVHALHTLPERVKYFQPSSRPTR